GRKTPYGLQVIEDCLTCPLVKDRIFCDLSRPAIAAMDSISSLATYPKDAILFVEGQDPTGRQDPGVLCVVSHADFLSRHGNELSHGTFETDAILFVVP